jgi:tRNA nucleotidyltransferase (CCA-adding enzyme)
MPDNPRQICKNIDPSQVYLVGGAVRDQLLGYPYKEQDYVVVGTKAQTMLEAGFTQVGKDFPVFLHPKTKQEYALARQERKTGAGYHGFEMDCSSEVTLEQDLARRDLTINAMAQDANEQIIDPFDGLQDLKHKKLRHVSEAFSEDPLRVLRVARFAARYHHLGFSVATETINLMQQLSASDELLTLAPERVFTEMNKALNERDPQVFFMVLRECGALKVLFPEIDNLYGVPNPPKWHPEIDSGIHTMMVLEQAAKLTDDANTRFGALCHDLGKAVTPKEFWPKHTGHEQAGVPLIKALCKRIKAPKSYQQLAILGSKFHLHGHRAFELRPETIHKLFTQLDAYRRPEIVKPFLDICEADSKGRTGYEDADYPQRRYLEHAFELAQNVSVKALQNDGVLPEDLSSVDGKQIGQQIDQQRIAVLKTHHKQQGST